MNALAGGGIILAASVCGVLKTTSKEPERDDR
jgi:hypothetical protein